jgi:hypothetical protein
MTVPPMRFQLRKRAFLALDKGGLRLRFSI